MGQIKAKTFTGIAESISDAGCCNQCHYKKVHLLISLLVTLMPLLKLTDRIRYHLAATHYWSRALVPMGKVNTP